MKIEYHLPEKELAKEELAALYEGWTVEKGFLDLDRLMGKGSDPLPEKYDDERRVW